MRSSPAAPTSAGRAGSPRAASPPSTPTSRPIPARPGKLALQYWFFYAFNDFNNTHEGDWEMIQLVFDADDAEEALGEEPVEVGYSSHEGAERADWDDDKLELVDGDAPGRLPGGRLAREQVHRRALPRQLGGGGRRLRRHARPARRAQAASSTTIPSDPAAAAGSVPLDHLRGALGRAAEGVLQRADRPEHEDAVDDADQWSEDWRDRSYAVPTGGVFGTSATDFFCTGVAKGSTALERAPAEPGGDAARHRRRPRAARASS